MTGARMTDAPECPMVLLVQAEIDGELDAAQATSLKSHREHCATCQQASAELQRARALFHPGIYQPMPDAVRARIMARLQGDRPEIQHAVPARRLGWRLRWQPLAGFGLGAACAAALSLLVLLPDREGVMDQIVAGHIRALQPGHLEDVVSTDQHTVKPWFDGRLDFAPPVKDFAAQGFPLSGGRLDYVDGRPVAALVYRRDKHVIDLFIWPETGGPAPDLRSETRHGYHVAHWSAGGMSLWAVSDVEADQLGQFVALWQRSS